MFINKTITVLIFITLVLYRLMPNDNIETFCEGNYNREINNNTARECIYDTYTSVLNR